MIQGVIEGMKERRFGRIVNITSAMVKSPHAAMGLSTAARSGLTALCRGLSNESAAFNVTINSLLPERFDTDRQKHLAKLMMARQGLTFEEARQAIANTINARRLGQPDEEIAAATKALDESEPRIPDHGRLEGSVRGLSGLNHREALGIGRIRLAMAGRSSNVQGRGTSPRTPCPGRSLRGPIPRQKSSQIIGATHQAAVDEYLG
jgi:hypothetical protein